MLLFETQCTFEGSNSKRRFIHCSNRVLHHSYSSNNLMITSSSEYFRYRNICSFTVVTQATSWLYLIRYMNFSLIGVTSAIMKGRWLISFNFFLFTMIRCLITLLTNFTIILLGPLPLFVRRCRTLMSVLFIVTPICLATSSIFLYMCLLCPSTTPELCNLSLLS